MKKIPLIKAAAPPMVLRPLFNRLVVSYVPPQMPKMIGDLHLPDDHQMLLPVSPYVRTKVLSVGPDCKHVKVGEEILINVGAIESMIIDSTNYAITTEDRIHAVVEPH